MLYIIFVCVCREQLLTDHYHASVLNLCPLVYLQSSDVLYPRIFKDSMINNQPEAFIIDIQRYSVENLILLGHESDSVRWCKLTRAHLKQTGGHSLGQEIKVQSWMVCTAKSNYTLNDDSDVVQKFKNMGGKMMQPSR